MRRAFVLGLSFALFSLQPTLGGAAIIERGFAHTAITIAAPFADFYDYTQATTTVWSSSADFDTGVYANTNSTDTPDSITLDRIGPAGVTAAAATIAWWDTDWTNRRCFSIDHTDPDATTVGEYQLRLDFPIDFLVDGGFLQADLGDLRAIGADGSSLLPLWIDDTAPDTIWVQMDSITAGTTEDLCLYYGYRAGTATSPANHAEASVFGYTVARDIYYAVADGYTAPGTDINIVSFTDANEVTRSDGTAVTLAAAGDLSTFDAAGTTAGSVFSVLGPISAQAVADGFDGLVPISFAGTRFLAPVSRDSQQFSFVAPFADAIVDLYDGSTLVATFPVASGTPYTHISADITSGNTAIIESDVPVLVTHTSDLGGDTVALYPETAGEFYGVRSTEILIGYGTDATQVTVTGSDAATSVAPGDRGDSNNLTGGAVQGGAAGDAIHLTADQPIGVAAHEDGDGGESVAILPWFELGSQYWIPTDSQYAALSCPTVESASIAITITPPGGAARPVTCSGGPTVAWAADTADLAVTATRGIEISSAASETFFAYYEGLAFDDQTSLLGMKQGRQYTWPEPILTAGPDEGLYQSTGTWVSPTIDIGAGSSVYGLVSIAGDVPSDTTLLIQLATANAGLPANFVGPDGTAGTYFAVSSLPAVADFDHDGDGLLRVRAEFETTDPVAAAPRLDSISIDHHLVMLDRSLAGSPSISVTTSVIPSVTTSYLLRVTTNNPAIVGSEATAVYRGDTNLANLAEETVRFVNRSLGVDSVQQSVTLPTELPPIFDAGHPHSVVIDHAAIGSGITLISFAWQLDYEGTGSIFSETDFVVEVTAP